MKFTIFKRMVAGYAVIMVMVLFMGIYVILKLNEMTDINHKIAKVDGVMITLGEQLVEVLFSQVGFERKYLIAGDPDFSREFHRTRTLFEEDVERMGHLADSETTKAWVDQVKAAYARYLRLFEEEEQLIARGEPFPRREYTEEKERLVAEIEKTLRDLIKTARSERDGKLAQSSRISFRAARVTLVAAGLTVLLGIVISLLITRNIARPISILGHKTREIASGRFHRISSIASPPEIKDLASDFNAMSERLQELDAMKLDFISHVSHELRTPLTSIKAASSMLLEGTFRSTPESREELLAIIRDECDRLIGAVNRILDISRMDAKMMDYHYSECTLLPILQRAVLKLAPLAQRKKIDLELEPVRELPPVRIDPDRIAQVMENLLGNALKFTPEGGKVSVFVYPMDGEERFVQVYVTDSGCGIPREDLARIFERFKRIDRRRETAMGTGLGLAIVKHIISDHGGKLWVRSAPGKGSTFSFALPVA
jgi:two-component system, NtrC family, sensor histidine kinase GlrK